MWGLKLEIILRSGTKQAFGKDRSEFLSGEESMAQITWWSLCLSVISLLFLLNPLSAEDYVSKDFPPNELMVKTIQTRLEKRDTKFGKLLGKRKTGEDSYTYVYTFLMGNNPVVTSAEIQKLDTNIWLLMMPGEMTPMILQK
jgi:hypothetical protein